ncbi:CHASE3 domain-containing protein [Geodermatophilus sp. SYSU D00742]
MSGDDVVALNPRLGSLRAVVHVVVAVLIGMLVVSAVVTGAARATVAAAQRTLSDEVLPARQATSDLVTAYVNQETGHRGFLLTGDPVFLEPYDQGRAAADGLQSRLADLLSDDAEGLALLEDVQAAGERWQRTVAEPGNAVRGAGPLADAEARSLAVDGKAQFDALRGRVTALEDRTVELTTAQLARIRGAQSLANVIAISAAVLAVAVGLGTWLFLRRRLTRPLQRLLTDVRVVADGDYDHRIDRRGPQELSLLADAVDRMRVSVVASGRERVAAQHELTLRQEHDRMAADLHDLTIQRVFGLGLRLASAGLRHPQLAPVADPLIEETDRIIRELRTVIFELSRHGSDSGETLRGATIGVVEGGVRALGFTPSLEFSGPVDTLVPDETAVEVLAVLQESLSNVARHARATRADVSLRVRDGLLELTVRDDGVGVDSASPRGNGLTNLHARAQRLGGEAGVGPGPDGRGTVVTWRVPVTRPEG